MNNERPRTFIGEGEAFSSLPAANHCCAKFNKEYPIGTAVIAWPLGFSSPARITRTRDLARARQVRESDGRANHRSKPEFVAETYVDGFGGPVSLGAVAAIVDDNLRGQLRIEINEVISVDLDSTDALPLLPTDLGIACRRAVDPLLQVLADRVEQCSRA